MSRGRSGLASCPSQVYEDRDKTKTGCNFDPRQCEPILTPVLNYGYLY